MQDAFENTLKRLEPLSDQAAAKQMGVHRTTIWRWRSGRNKPRQSTEPVTLDELGFCRCKQPIPCPRTGCNNKMLLMSQSGICPECEIFERAKAGQVVLNG